MGNDDSMLDDFLAESREHLNSIEPDLLEMERSGATTPKEALNRVFRAIHSIKGASGFFDFQALKRLSHAMENVLMPIRDGQLQAKSDIVDVLLAGVDTLRAMLDDVHASDSIPCDDTIERLNHLLQASREAAPPAVEDAAAGLQLDAVFDPAAEPVRSAVARGMSIYRVKVNLLHDLTHKNRDAEAFSNAVLSLGQVIAFPPDAEKLGDKLRHDICFSFVMGSVLTPPLLAQGLDLPPARIEPVDAGAVRQAVLDERRKTSPSFVPPAASAAPTPSPEPISTSQPVPAPAPAAANASSASPAAPAQAQAPAQAKHEGVESIRVRVDLLSRVMNGASELVLARNQLLSMLDRHARDIPGLPPVLQHLDRTVSELQERTMQTRMQPLDSLFAKFSRMVRDLARQMNKTVELAVEGAEVELDKSVIELLGDPLTHLIRNCVDHGIEPSQERQAAGKPPAGHIVLRAYQQGGQVNIEIRDDGRGIDVRKVVEKAVERGVITAAQGQTMSPREATNLIFLPGFSTAAKITEVSGRGVGLDVVRTNVEKLGGQVEVESAVGTGSTFLLRLPLTLAIIPALTVGAGGQKFAVPQMNLVELVQVRASDAARRIEKVNRRAVLRLRGQVLPLLRLTSILGLRAAFADTGGASRDDRRQAGDRRSRTPAGTPAGRRVRKADRRADGRTDHRILIVQTGATRFGLMVDDLFDSGEVVVKPLSALAVGSGCFAGSTITGDGRVILILDVGGLAARAKLDTVENGHEAAQAPLAAGGGDRQSIILFNHGDNELLAVPQEQLVRLERTHQEQIQRVGGREFVQYRGAAMPVVRLDAHLPLGPLPTDTRDLYLLIPKRADGRVAGILASRIVDALDVDVAVQPGGVSGPGVRGTAVVGGKLALFLDPGPLLDSALLEASA